MPGILDGGFRGSCIVTEINQRRYDIGFDACRRGCGGFLRFQRDDFQFVLQLNHHAFRGLASNAGNFRKPRQIAMANRRDQFLHAHSGENLQRQSRADAGSGEKHLEKMLFAGGNKPIESQGILADMRMDEKGNFSMKFTESSVRRKRYLDEITHAADVNEDLVGTFFR